MKDYECDVLTVPGLRTSDEKFQIRCRLFYSIKLTDFDARVMLKLTGFDNHVIYLQRIEQTNGLTRVGTIFRNNISYKTISQLSTHACDIESDEDMCM
jgi:hypothetical protein